MSVILLDINYRYHQTITVKKAMNLLCRGVAEVVKNTEQKLHENFFVPAVLRLVKAIRKMYGRAIKWSKAHMFIRDEYTCQYCGEKLPAHKLTIDHVKPQDLGGKTEWENCVSSCNACNNRKGNRTLHEMGYTLKRKPIQPTVMEFTQKHIKVLGIDSILKKLGVY